MEKRYGCITGWGAYVPEKVVTNFDLEKTLNTSNEWIVQRTGIERRHIAAPAETTATMATAASQNALQQANLTPSDIDLIIVATSTPDHLTPPVSSQIQHMLGAQAPAFVMVTGCTGFVYALTTASQFIQSGSYRTILVVGVELLSRHVDWSDRAMCVLFGDAAGAVIMQATHEPCGIHGFNLGSDGSGAEHIIAPACGSAEPVNENTFVDGRQFIRMNGREVFKFATRVIGRSCREALGMAGRSVADIDWIIPHQANLRIIQAAARDMKLPLDRFLINIQNYANTSAASIPLALTEALQSGKVKPDDTVLMTSFGAGLTWATAVLQLAPKVMRSNGVVVGVNGRVLQLLDH